MDGNKIIHTQKWDNDTKQTTIERFVDNEGHLIMVSYIKIVYHLKTLRDVCIACSTKINSRKVLFDLTSAYLAYLCKKQVKS